MHRISRAGSWVMIMGLASAVHAAPIYVDQFIVGSNPAAGEYTAGSLLSTQNPTITNAAGTWTYRDDGGGQSSSVGVRVASTGLILGGLGTAGGSIESFRTSGSSAADTFLLGRPAINNSDTTINSSEVLYFSALVRFAAGQQAGVGAQIENRTPFGVGFDTDGKVGTFVGSGSGSQSGFSSFQATVNNAVNNLPYTADTNYLIVGRMVPNNGATSDPESIQLLAVNPTNTVEPGTAITSYGFNAWGNAGTTDTITHFLALTSKAASNGTVASADELRFGTAYADVVVVPEPASLALVGLVGLVVGRRRR